jgi:lipopolysaccharide transport system permease protein
LAFNPILWLVRGYRAILLENRAPDASVIAALWIGSVVLAVAGYAWFHRLRKSFADVI